jgi:myosin heavy subunit
MKWVNQVKHQSLQPGTTPKKIFLKLEDIERSYNSELKSLVSKSNELQQNEVQLKIEIEALNQKGIEALAKIKNLSQQGINMLRDVNRKTISVVEQSGQEDQAFETIEQILSDQDFEISSQRRSELEAIEKQRIEIEARCHTIQKHLSNLNQARSESELLIEAIQKQRDEAIQQNTSLQTNVHTLQSSYQHEVLRLGNHHQKDIAQLEEQLEKLKSSDNAYSLHKSREATQRKYNATFYTVLIAGVFGMILTFGLIIFNTSDKSSHESKFPPGALINTAISLASQGFVVLVYRMNRRCEQRVNTLDERLERHKSEEKIDGHIYTLMEMLKEPQTPEIFQQQLAECLTELRALKRSLSPKSDLETIIKSDSESTI